MRFRSRFGGVLLCFRLDRRAGYRAVIQNMTDAVHNPVKLKEQDKLRALTHTAVFHQHSLTIQLFLQDLRAKPLRDQGNFQIAAVSVIGHGTEIHNAIRIERGTFPSASSRCLPHRELPEHENKIREPEQFFQTVQAPGNPLFSALFRYSISPPVTSTRHTPHEYQIRTYPHKITEI